MYACWWCRRTLCTTLKLFWEMIYDSISSSVSASVSINVKGNATKQALTRRVDERSRAEIDWHNVRTHEGTFRTINTKAVNVTRMLRELHFGRGKLKMQEEATPLSIKIYSDPFNRGGGSRCATTCAQLRAAL